MTRPRRRPFWTPWRREAEPSRKARRNRRIRGRDTWEAETRRLDRARRRRLRYLFGSGTWTDRNRRIRQRQRWRVRRERRRRITQAGRYLGWRLAGAGVLVAAGVWVWPSSWVAGAALTLAGLAVGGGAAATVAARQRRRYRW